MVTFRATGSVLEKKKTRKRHVVTEETLDYIGARLQATSKKLCLLALQRGMPGSTVYAATKVSVLRHVYSLLSPD